MFYVDELREGVFAIDSEPGDATKYEYIMVLDGDTLNACALSGRIRYPPTLDFFEVEELGDIELVAMAKKIQVNPFTLIEVIRSWKILRKTRKPSLVRKCFGAE